MIKIAFLKTRAHFKGGLEKYTLNLLQTFAEEKCQVTLLTTGTPLCIPGVNCISLGPDSRCTLYQLVHFDTLCQKWLQKNPQDIVFGMERTTQQTHYRAGNGVHAIYLERRKMVDTLWKRMTFPLNPLHQTLLSMEKMAFEDRNLKVLFTNSYMVKNEILKTYKTPPDKIEVIHNGVEWEKWSEEFEKTFIYKKRGAPHLLFVGNGYKRKGLSFLLQSLARLKNEDFRLTVIGKDKNPLRYVRLAEKLGIKKKIDFMGPQSDLLPFYRAADTLIIPSIYDPFANVTVEALAMGLYVLSSSYNGGQEILQEYSGTIIDDLLSPETFAHELKNVFNIPKTEERARKIRQSIKNLDFSKQLVKIVRKTLCTF